MKLSSDYQRVVALFETLPGERVEYENRDEESRSEFQVGPFSYEITFELDEDDGFVYVKFQLIDIDATDEEIVQMMSKLVPEEERPVSLEEARKTEQQMIHNQSHDLLSITGQNAFRIFGIVLNIIQDYVRNHRTRRIKFSSQAMKRTNLYARMMQRAFPQARIQQVASPWGSGIEFRVYFRR